MKHNNLKQAGLAALTLISVCGLAAVPVSALAAVGATTDVSTASSGTSAGNTKQLQLIISRGNIEITRRLSTLNKLTSKISGNTKLSSSDKSSLSSEVSGEISGLTSLKSSLDGDTTVANAKTDAQSIIDDYRVYALIGPKVYLVKTADDQQVAEGKLTTLAGKLQNDITADQNDGKNVATLQSELNDLTAKAQAAQAISSNIESSVVGLQPSDYNSDHSVLSGDRNQLKTAQTDIAAAVSDAKNIITALRNL